MLKVSPLALLLVFAGCIPPPGQTYAPTAYRSTPTLAQYNQSVGQAERARYWQETAPQRSQESAIRQQLKQQESEREAQQGPVRKLGDDQCYSVLRGVPQAAHTRAGVGPGNPNPVNPFYTPQEQYCQALGLSHESPADNTFPGMLPDGARAVSTGNGHWLVNY